MGRGGIVYIQVKDPPTEEAELKALKDRLRPCHDVIGECTYTHRSGETWTRYNTATITVEIVAVKYDYRDLWRWAIVLDRFAVSAANTIGVISALVWWNQEYSGGLVVYPEVFLNGLSGVTENQPADILETIMVDTRGDQQVVVDALPALLPLLGIPVDAVGVVHRRH